MPAVERLLNRLGQELITLLLPLLPAEEAGLNLPLLLLEMTLPSPGQGSKDTDRKGKDPAPVLISHALNEDALKGNREGIAASRRDILHGGDRVAREEHKQLLRGEGTILLEALRGVRLAALQVLG